jgi:hypothetical protein
MSRSGAATDTPSGSIGTTGGTVVIAVARARGCGSSAGYGADASANRRSYASTTPAARDRADYSPGAGTNQTAADRAIGRIVRVREGCCSEHQPHADHAGDSRLLSHSLLPESNSQCYRAND